MGNINILMSTRKYKIAKCLSPLSDRDNMNGVTLLYCLLMVHINSLSLVYEFTEQNDMKITVNN